MEYFKIERKQDFLQNVESKYDSDNAGTIWYFDTRNKLQYLIGLIEGRLNLSLVNNYNEKPNGMAGQGMGFKLKSYVLTGFIEKKFHQKIKKKCFLKIQFYESKGELYFSTDIDVNFSDGNNKLADDRDSLQSNTSHSWIVDDNFPKDWNTLLDLIIPKITENVNYLDNYITKQILPIMNTTEENKNHSFENQPLNQILYGPPGTGKTYNSINKAISIINPDFDFARDRSLIKEEFETLVLENRVLFTTFHQSMNYEDFIEGIKPGMKEDNDSFLKYAIEEGLFKVACANAAFLCYKKYQSTKRKQFHYTFDDLYEAFIEKIQDLLDKETPPIFKTLTGREVTVIKINSNNSIKARAKNSKAVRNPAPLTKENLQKLYDKFDSVDEITNLKQVKETVEITPRITEFYAVFKELKRFEKEEFQHDADFLRDTTDVDSYDLEEVIRKFNAGVYTNAIKEFGKISEPVVLIIDEINRGNVSQIFGELITLIEEDKRLGKEEGLEIMLPYSKSKFGVPPNLYIVGTMNTADRSVEALDTALRRRFNFEEIVPNSQLIATKGKSKESNGEVEGISLPKVLETINNRIEVLSNRDHKIGHSYFMKVVSLVDLRETFKKNIIPLLQEYFYNDYEKIGWVLGEGFFKEEKIDKKVIFGKFFKEMKPEFEVAYQLANIDEIDIKLAMEKLLGTVSTIAFDNIEN